MIIIMAYISEMDNVGMVSVAKQNLRTEDETFIRLAVDTPASTYLYLLIHVLH